MSKRMKDSPAAWLAEEVERVRARRDLSDEGRLAHLGRAYTMAKGTADTTAKAKKADYDATRQQHLRGLFGPAQHTAEWRRLRDRAQGIKDPAKLRRELDSALLTGDREEAAALGAVALDRALGRGPDAAKWVDIVNTWGASDPTIDQRLTALSEHEASAQTLTESASSWVPMPRELAQAGNSWQKLVDRADAPDRADLTPEEQHKAEVAEGWAQTWSQQSSGRRGGF